MWDKSGSVDQGSWLVAVFENSDFPNHVTERDRTARPGTESATSVNYFGYAITDRRRGPNDGYLELCKERAH